MSSGSLMIYSTASESASGTPAATQTSAGSGDQNSGNSSGLFSANGTPALILAFLAIGLFVGGMVTMFGLRRRRMLGLVVGGRFIGVRRGGADAWELDPPEIDAVQRRAERRRRRFGRKPELFEYHVAEKGKDGAEEVRWERVLPISAKVLVTEEPFFSTLSTRSAEPLHSGSYLSRLNTLIPHGLPGLRRNPLSNESTTQPATPVPQPTDIQVAVAIAMPVPPSYQHDAGIPDFTLGLAQLRWDGENQAQLADSLSPVSVLSEDA